MWCNVRAVTLNAALQLLVIYRFVRYISESCSLCNLGIGSELDTLKSISKSEWRIYNLLHEASPLYFRELGIGIVAYSPLGRGFFGGKGAVESLPTGSLLVRDYELIMSNINFCIMVFWFINLNELDYARNSLQILTPNLEAVLPDYELHIWVYDFLFGRGICILNSNSCSCHRIIIQGSMMRIWIETNFFIANFLIWLQNMLAPLLN